MDYTSILWIVILFSVVIVLSVRSIVKNRRDNTNSTFPPGLSEEEKDLLRKVAEYTGNRNVSSDDMKVYTIHKIAALFSCMPGWDIWDESIHSVEGQYERMESAAMSESMSILQYDPQSKTAEIQGETGVYHVCGDACTCPDFTHRHLPCKHMYLLAMQLDGQPDKEIDAQNQSRV